jgi:hypothetical protein
MRWRGQKRTGKRPKPALQSRKYMLHIWCKIDRFALAETLIERYT